MKEKEIVKRTRRFAIETIKLANQFPKTPAGFRIGNQLVGSGTSIGANIEEAQEAVSKKEFLKFINIALRESRETIYWLTITLEANILPKRKINLLLKEAKEIRLVLATIVKKTKENLKNN